MMRAGCNGVVSVRMNNCPSLAGASHILPALNSVYNGSTAIQSRRSDVSGHPLQLDN